MIGMLRGKVLALNTLSALVDVSGVGYEVLVSNRLADSLNAGSEVSLHIYTDVRETAITLFGFSEAVEKQVFLLLKKVKGVGPRLGLAIVSEIGAKQVLGAIAADDLSSFTQVSGVGRKTAERIIVELREQVSALIISDSSIGNLAGELEISVSRPGGVEADTISALEKLGFPKAQCESVVGNIVREKELNNPDAGELLHLSLARLGDSV